MIHRTLNDANRAAAEMSRFGHCTYTVVALDDGTYETVNGTTRGKLVSRWLNGREKELYRDAYEREQERKRLDWDNQTFTRI